MPEEAKSAPAPTLAPTPAPKAQQKMLDRNFGVCTFKYNRWAADLDENQTIEDALAPQFWAGQAEKIMGHNRASPKGRGDIIELRQLSTGLYVELLVTEVGTGYIKVAPIRQHKPEAIALPEKLPFEVRWNEAKKGHLVIRKSDKLVMAAGPFQTKEAAAAWIADHMKAMAV